VTNQSKKKKSASSILHNRYINNDPEMKELLEEAREEYEIALQIYKLRQDAGLTQAELANILGTQPSAICRLEDADYEGHSLAMLRKIAKALNKKVKITFMPLEGDEAA
jgi:DNA-binding XRE family transcriptional regulator